MTASGTLSWELQQPSSALRYFTKPKVWTNWRKLHQVANRAERQMLRTFRAGIADVREQAARTRTDDLVEGGVTIDEWFARIPQYRVLLNELEKQERQAYQQGLALAGDRDLRQAFEFVLDPGRTKAIGQRIVGINENTRLAVQQIITNGIQRGDSPAVVARLIREQVGLTPRQVTAINNFGQNAIAQGVDSELALQRTERYAQKLLNYRAKAIARTESIWALNTATLDQWQNAQANGLLEQNVRKVWIVTPDDRLCDRCAAMEGVTVPIQDDFVSDLGESVTAPPLHTMCRCAMGLEVVEPPDITALLDQMPEEQILQGPLPDPEDYLQFKTAELSGKAKAWEKKLLKSPIGDPYGSIRYYTGDGFIDVNRLLRGTSNMGEQFRSGIWNRIANIDRGLEDAAKTGRKGKVFRSTSSFNSVTEGQIVTEPGFSSTTISEDLAQKWGKHKGHKVVEILLPEHAPASYVEPFTVNRGEYELLLPRNSQFKVISLSEKKVMVEWIGTLEL